jgi:FkbM family methyltransferase
MSSSPAAPLPLKKSPFRGVQKLIRKLTGQQSEFAMSKLLGRFSQREIPVNTVIDIGASNGSWSRQCLQFLPKAKYLAIDPLREREPDLAAMKQQFPNFDYALCVAGEHDGTSVTLNVTDDLDGSTVAGENPGTARVVPVRSIDALIAERQLPGPYLLKFDTHGFELPILAGCMQTLADTSAIIMEVYNFQLTPTSLRFADMIQHLERQGFRTADIADPLHRKADGLFWQIDYLFLRAENDLFQYPHYR